MKITREKLESLTDSGSWDRGIRYFEQERVLRIMTDGGVVTARVLGSHTYTVELWADEAGIRGDCTCPMGDRGVFCKHCVATGLECLERGLTELGAEKVHTDRPESEETETGADVTDMDDIRSYLQDHDKEELIDIVITQAKTDESLLRRLATGAAMATGKKLGIDRFKRAIDEAMSAPGFVDYGGAYSFASSVDEVVDEIAALLERGHAEEVIELSAYAVGEVERALGYVDDSDGWLGMTLDHLEEIHYQACQAANPDPEWLADHLFQLELRSEYGPFYKTAYTYNELLGDEGLAEYRRLAEKKWEDIPQLEPGDEGAYYGVRSRLESIMESLAEASGDVEELVRIKSRNLSVFWHYLQIAEIYRQDRQYNKAMEWAEKGLEAFPDRRDSKLLEFLANEYHRRSRHEEAVELIWEGFQNQPGPQNYKSLKEHAERADAWPNWRQRALSLLTEQAKQRGSGGSMWAPAPAGTDLVDVYLWEEKPDLAWETAQEYGCTRHQWLELAARREEDHPDDAIEIYQDQVRNLVNRTKNSAYREATKLVRKIRKLMDESGREDKFPEYIEHLRTEFKRKRNFMKMLDELR